MKPNVVLLLPVFVLACAGPNRSPTVIYPRSPAEGRPTTCPVNITQRDAQGRPTPVATRCAYEDTSGRGMTRLGGKVYVETPEGGLGKAAPDMVVTVHRVREPARRPGSGEKIAETTTDTQGGFHVSALFRASQYDVVVRDPRDGRILTFRRIRLGGSEPVVVEDLRLTLPAVLP